VRIMGRVRLVYEIYHVGGGGGGGEDSPDTLDLSWGMVLRLDSGILVVWGADP
jgi:hypothetical protein